MKLYVIYQFFCPGCNSKYIGKTEWNLCVWLEEHATDNGSSVFNHISDCANYQYIKNLHCIENKSFDSYTYDINYIQENTSIIDSARNWNTLLIKEALQFSYLRRIRLKVFRKIYWRNWILLKIKSAIDALIIIGRKFFKQKFLRTATDRYLWKLF